MRTVNRFLLLAAVSILSFSSCQNLKTREDLKGKAGSEKSEDGISDSKSDKKSQNTEAGSDSASGATNAQGNDLENSAKNDQLINSRTKDLPKIGIIFGAGGAKVIASVGILKELQKFKIPIYSVGGIELGAFVAATFAKNKLANDVDWQFSKLDVRAFGSTQNSQQLTQFLALSWSGETLDRLKAPFACPSLHIGRQQSYVLAKGVVRQVLSYCMSYPPVFMPHDQSVADLHGVKSLADYMRQRGANYIVFVNFLASESKTPRSFLANYDRIENIAWSEASAAYKNLSGVEYVLNINSDNFGLLNFDKKKELISSGQDQSKKFIMHLQEKFGL